MNNTYFVCLQTGMTARALAVKIKAVKQCAVAQFSAKHNAQQHDEARKKSPPPHPNKLVRIAEKLQDTMKHDLLL